MSGKGVEHPRVVILSACEISAEAERYLKPDDFIIACDAGYRNAERLGLSPDVIVGDFDSAPPPDRDDLIILPHVKDDTDTQYAAKLALEYGAKQVVMLGALGGKRLEHTLANISTGLWLTKQGVEVTIADSYSELRYLLPESPLTLQRENWQYLSLFPLEGALDGVDLQGTFYPLKDATLRAEYPLGVSNEFVQPTATLFCKSGVGLVVLTVEDNKPYKS